MNLQDKVALITGSSRGIGRATAFLFAEKGAKIIVNYDKEKSDAERVVEQIKKNETEAIAVKCDVSDENQVKKMVSYVIKKFGRIDILVNNAGVVYDVPFFKRIVSPGSASSARQGQRRCQSDDRRSGLSRFSWHHHGGTRRPRKRTGHPRRHQAHESRRRRTVVFGKIRAGVDAPTGLVDRMDM